MKVEFETRYWLSPPLEYLPSWVALKRTEGNTLNEVLAALHSNSEFGRVTADPTTRIDCKEAKDNVQQKSTSLHPTQNTRVEKSLLFPLTSVSPRNRRICLSS